MITLIEERLSTLLPGNDRLTQAMRYSLLSGGKRLRPLFVLHVVDTFNPERFEEGMQGALALECIHTYSLIHDDLPCMDNDDLRRGKPSLHKAFGEDTALLAGDALLTLGFELLGSIGHPLLVSKFARLIGYEGMVAGQIMDMAFSPHDCTKEKIFHLYELKTANLFVAALDIGAIIAGADIGTQTLLASYGKWFGIAFQIADDIEDHLSGKEEKIARSIGLEQLISWYEEAKSEAVRLNPPVLFLQDAFDFLDKKVFTP